MSKLPDTAWLIAALLAVSLPPACVAQARTSEPVNLTCNTAANEDDPHVSSDGRTLFYSSDAKGKYDLMLAERRSARLSWPKGELLDDYTRSEVDDRSAFLHDLRYPRYLFFATKKDRQINNFDLYVATQQRPDASYSAPTPINTIATPEDELHPWLTRDGRRLYFSRKTRDGWRVLVATRRAAVGAAGFGRPSLIEELPAGFHHPTLTPDGRTMYLQGPLEKDRWGLFVSRFAGGKWGKPEPLPINSPDAPTGDVSPNLSRDGRLLYFASDRPGGKGKRDLWVIPTAALRKMK